MRLTFPGGVIDVSESNPYMLSDRCKFMFLYETVRDYSDCYATVLKHSRKDIGEWLDSVLEPVAEEYRSEKLEYVIPARNRLWFVFHGMTRPLRCPTCGKTVFKKVLSITQEHEPYCCCRCAGSNPESIRKLMETKAAKYGDPFFNNRGKFAETVASMSAERRSEWRKRILDAFHDRFGADSYMETDEFREKAEQWVKDTYGEEYSNVLQVPEVRAENEKKRLEEHGHPQWSNWEKGRETCLEHHGVDVIFKSEEFIKERAAALIDEYGVPFVPLRLYEYGESCYDSKPELAFAVWAADNGMVVERNESICFKFEFNGKTRTYWPDFIVDGKPVEIKGDQFFREDGTMFCPYRREDCSDEEYNDICGRYEAKRRCMVDNGVRIIRTAEYKAYIEYVEKKYGKDFFEKHRKTKAEPGK